MAQTKIELLCNNQFLEISPRNHGINHGWKSKKYRISKSTLNEKMYKRHSKKFKRYPRISPSILKEMWMVADVDRKYCIPQAIGIKETYLRPDIRKGNDKARLGIVYKITKEAFNALNDSTRLFNPNYN